MKLIHFKQIVFILISLVILSLGSCVKSPDTTLVDEISITNMSVSPDFKFSTTENINLRVSALDNIGKGVPGIKVNIYTDRPEKGGALILSFSTDNSGIYSTILKVPAGTDSLVVGTNAIGFPDMQKLKIVSGSLNCVFGGVPVTQSASISIGSLLKSSSGVFRLLGTYNSDGVPNYLVLPNDIIDAALIADINATLPDYKPLPVFHPAYFDATNESNLILQEASGVWVTFVHEGAGYRNTLAFYKYKVNNPPASIANIDTIFIAFPNVSFKGSGGGLYSGNKVFLGNFPAGTGIGFALIANGYNGSSVTNGNATFYSDTRFNPEINPNLRKHCVLLNDIGRGKFLLSFEDFNREAGSDNDFNDAIFFLSTNTVQSVNTTHLPIPSYVAIDSDHDGTPDNIDDYPNDASKAFNNYYPSKNNINTLSFEDLWPSMGDYDFNDMVLTYNFNQITNSQNQLVQIKALISPIAIGAGYHSGFGLQLPISSNLVTSVTGTDVRKPYIIMNPNGTEAGQAKATIIAFDDAFNELPYPGGGATGVNTSKGSPYVQPKVLEITINLTSPVSLRTFGNPPYNPFIIINEVRAHEVHLIDNAPTDLADKSLLGTANDNSNPGIGRYYVTAQNLPYAIDIAGAFDSPSEKTMITKAYLKFFEWGVSAGFQFNDWYKPLGGYRNTNNIYIH